MFPQAEIDEMWEKAVKGVPKLNPQRSPQQKALKGWRAHGTFFKPKNTSDNKRRNLTDDDVRAIRQALEHGETLVEIARRFETSKETVSKIRQKRWYRDVQ